MANRYIIRLHTKDNQFRVVAENGQGPSGISAYQQALNNGFVGTEQEWLESLVGPSAYEVALNNGFVGTEQEWLDSLKAQIDVEPADAGKVYSNDGDSSDWYDINTIINNNNIHWDLGELK